MPTVWDAIVIVLAVAFLIGVARLFDRRDRNHPVGLCGNKADHKPHLVKWAAVSNGPMWCTADQSQRLPDKAERIRRERETHDGEDQRP